TQKGYSWCGDWKPAVSKFPDMAAHVAQVHKLGMKYMVWYSVPFVGKNSEAYGIFKGKFLRDDGNTAILDPRFPDVRDHLIGIYVKALKDWDLDGFKLDFIDEFKFKGKDPALDDGYAGRDILNVSEAVNVLMKDVSSTLHSIKPDILLEFRQAYIGPAIRQYGNMFRAADCPGNAADNRVRIANLRLIAGGTAVHSDMLEWHLAETPENVGRTIISSIFGVIQYSVMLETLPQEQADMVRMWLDFAREHRETLLKGRFRPRHPELRYPVIEAESGTERIVAVFQDNAVIDRGDRSKKLYVLNASGSPKVRIEQPNGKIITAEVPCGGWSSIK
ncbi:MAG: glycoside hydrolase family 36 protein, partial [Candidatus Cryptobacteroides sp.]